MALFSLFPARLLATCLTSVLLAVAVAAPVSASDDIDTSNATFAEAIQAVKDRDFRHAIKLFRLQAEQNQHDAQYNLALLLEAGKGAPQNFSEALVWAWSAKLGGIEASGDLAEDLLDMLPEDAVDDVRRVQRRASTPRLSIESGEDATRERRDDVWRLERARGRAQSGRGQRLCFRMACACIISS